MARKSHKLLWVAGAGVGAWVAYRYVYQPWAQQRAAAAAAGGTVAGPGVPALQGLSSLLNLPASLLPAPHYMISEPPTLPLPTNTALPNTTSTTSTGVVITTTPSIGASVGGVVGACMAKKGGTWTQSQCTERLNALVQAARNARQAIQQLQDTSNPAAAGLAAAQAALASEQAALAGATSAYNSAVATGDPSAAAWHAAILGHQSDIADLTARIAAASAPVDNSAAIAAFEGQLAANDNDYYNLTGVHLLSGL